MNDFNIFGEIRIKIDFDVKAESSEEAIKQATETLKDYYHLRVQGAYHNPEDGVKLGLVSTLIEYEDE